MKKPWIMMQEWHDVLFLHWPIAPELMKPNIPEDLELDLFDGSAWVSLVLFLAKHTRPRFLPPLLKAGTYLELNVRTYVKYKEKSGVFFFSLDADSPLIVQAANMGNFMPYRHAQMAMEKHKNTWRFESTRTHENSFPEHLNLSFRLDSNPFIYTGLEYWLTERYCLWTKPKKRLVRVDIEHAPWELSYVKGTVYRNTMANFLSVPFIQEQAITHYAKKRTVRFYPPVLETN